MNEQQNQTSKRIRRQTRRMTNDKFGTEEPEENWSRFITQWPSGRSFGWHQTSKVQHIITFIFAQMTFDICRTWNTLRCDPRDVFCLYWLVISMLIRYLFDCFEMDLFQLMMNAPSCFDHHNYFNRAFVYLLQFSNDSEINREQFFNWLRIWSKNKPNSNIQQCMRSDYSDRAVHSSRWFPHYPIHTSVWYYQ